MSYSVDDPFFDQPGLDYLNPVTTWTEIPDDVAEVDVALIVVNYRPGGGGRVVRAEITRSPAYITANHGRMIDPAVVLEMVADGHDVKVSRFVVRGGLLDLIDPDLADELREEDA